jgi:oxygen-dependent protoporphyrinogen oxidase
VGAGMSGVAAAHALSQAGYKPEILEAGATLGGRAGSMQLGDKNIDIGGKNIGRKYARFREFIRQYGSPPLEFFGINSSTVRNGRLHTLDSQKKLSSFWHVLRLVGAKDFVRLAQLARVIRANSEEGMLGGAHFSELSEQRDHLPLSAWFGMDTVEGFLRPITLRMNGAEPDRYFFGCLGSNLRMIFDSYDQLTHGMSELLDRFARTVPVQLSTRVTRLLWSGSRVTGVEIEHGGNRERRQYDAVVLALPAVASARLLEGTQIQSALEAVSYNPVTLIVARYARPIFDRKVRAIVFDPESPLSNAGCYGVNDLDVVRYTLSGRMAASIDEGTEPAFVLGLAEAQLRRFLPVSASDRVDYVYKHFRHGLCAYGPYHHRFIQQLFDWESSVSGLTLTGDYVRGASIEACFHAAFEGVARLTRRISESNARGHALNGLHGNAPGQPSAQAARGQRSQSFPLLS